jgi:hypothetical protein
MDRNITETDLISYFYNECDNQIAAHIKSNLTFNPHWTDFLNDLQKLSDCMKAEVNPHATSVQIILEESLYEENHSI